ncbi:MAG: DUF5615 family PIN-like protein [Bacteroidota bacterium]
MVRDMDPCMTDQKVWEYALATDKIILTKDADYYFKCLVSEERPKVAHFEMVTPPCRNCTSILSRLGRK